jgi:hypothetical protein
MLAGCFVAGELTAEQIVARCSRMLGRRWRWLTPLAQRYVETFRAHTRPRNSEVVQFLAEDSGFQRAWARHASELYIEQWLGDPQKMQPVRAAREWAVPTIESVGALSNWFGVTLGELEWFSDLKGLTSRKCCRKLGHYHYRILSKASRGIRLIEAPKLKLKKMQRRILTDILHKIPAHFAAHGFVKGRSIMTFAGPHVGQEVVLRMDLQDFFPTFRAARVQTLFRTLGYPEAVADMLGGVCTSVVPDYVWKELAIDCDPSHLQAARSLYRRPHLPQGAPTSPALANLCTHRVDRRLSGLAKRVEAKYTRYGDDLAFSGGDGLERIIERFSVHVAAILLDEGFTVNYRKTRVMRQGGRQQLAGLVVNRRANVIRQDFDRLKAILTNCIRLGPDSQNRDYRPHFRLHLEGRVSFIEMVNPHRGARLRKLFDQIRWE